MCYPIDGTSLLPPSGRLASAAARMMQALRRRRAKAPARPSVLPEPARPRSSLPCVADALAIEIDDHGSPVTLPEAQWLVCFVPGLQRQWWHRFADSRHKHVFALRMVDEERWLLVEPWWTRLMVSVLTVDEAVKFLRWAAAGDILRVRESIPGRGCQARGWSNCAVLIAFMLGRSYWTWTPNGLYRRLRAERDTERVELPQILGESFRIAADRTAGDAIRPPASWRLTG